MDWPNVQLPSSLEETTEDPAIRSEAESGAVKTRPRYTRIRRGWQLGWANMRGADYRLLRVFFEQARGGTLDFGWRHPRENAIFRVRFEGPITGCHTVMDCWNVTLTLRQV